MGIGRGEGGRRRGLVNFQVFRGQFRFNYNYGTETIRSTQLRTVFFSAAIEHAVRDTCMEIATGSGDSPPKGYTLQAQQTLGNFLSIYIKVTNNKVWEGAEARISKTV